MAPDSSARPPEQTLHGSHHDAHNDTEAVFAASRPKASGHDLGLCQGDSLTAKKNELPKPKPPTKPTSTPKGDPGSDEAALSRNVGRQQSERHLEPKSSPCMLPNGSGASSSRADVFGQKLSFIKWAAALPRLLLATNTSFSRLLRVSFSVRFHEGEPPSHTALFPLPAPCQGAFCKGAPKRCSRSVRCPPSWLSR